MGRSGREGMEGDGSWCHVVIVRSSVSQNLEHHHTLTRSDSATAKQAIRTVRAGTVGRALRLVLGRRLGQQSWHADGSIRRPRIHHTKQHPRSRGFSDA